MANKIIKQLVSIPGLAVECPHCNEEFPVSRGKLFGMYDSYPRPVKEIIQQRLEAAKDLKKEVKERQRELADNRKTKPEKITMSAHGSNFGKIAEQIVPAFLTFPYAQNECRPLFEPVDYIVFAGLARKRHVEAITLVDVKTGDGRLSKGQRQIRDRVVEGKIKLRVIGR